MARFVAKNYYRKLCDQAASNDQHVLVLVLDRTKPVIEITQLTIAAHFRHIARVDKDVLSSSELYNYSILVSWKKTNVHRAWALI